MLDKASAVKITLEINQDTNLDELMAHLYLMQNAIPVENAANEALLPDFTVHEGELDLLGSGSQDC